MVVNLQTIILRKPFFTKRTARAWVKRRKYKFSKIDETPRTFRFRQLNPKLFKRFRTKVVNKNISLVIGLKR